MTDYGPQDALVAAFIDDLGGCDDQALWLLEEAVAENLRRDVLVRWVGATRPRPDTYALAAASDRLLAWHEAGHHTRLAVRPRDDESVQVDLPGEATNVSLPHLAALAPVIAQALVVQDRMTANRFLEVIVGWPEAVAGYTVPWLDDLTGLPRWINPPIPATFDSPLSVNAVADWLATPPDDLVLLWIDVRGIKRVNDTSGLPAGDALLRAAAASLAEAADPGLAFRCGGTEFLIARRLTDDDAIRVLATRVRVVIAQEFDRHWNGAWLGAVRAGSVKDLARLTRLADQAVSAAISSGQTDGVTIVMSDSSSG